MIGMHEYVDISSVTQGYMQVNRWNETVDNGAPIVI